MTFPERLELLLKQKKLTQRELAEYLNIRRPSVSDWKNGAFPRVDIAIKIAKKLGTTVEYLITGKEADGFSHEERELVAKYKNLSGDDKRNVQALIDSMLSGHNVGKKDKPA